MDAGAAVNQHGVDWCLSAIRAVLPVYGVKPDVRGGLTDITLMYELQSRRRSVMTYEFIGGITLTLQRNIPPGVVSGQRIPFGGMLLDPVHRFLESRPSRVS